MELLHHAEHAPEFADVVRRRGCGGLADELRVVGEDHRDVGDFGDGLAGTWIGSTFPDESCDSSPPLPRASAAIVARSLRSAVPRSTELFHPKAAPAASPATARIAAIPGRDVAVPATMLRGGPDRGRVRDRRWLAVGDGGQLLKARRAVHRGAAFGFARCEASRSKLRDGCDDYSGVILRRRDRSEPRGRARPTRRGGLGRHRFYVVALMDPSNPVCKLGTMAQHAESRPGRLLSDTQPPRSRTMPISGTPSDPWLRTPPNCRRRTHVRSRLCPGSERLRSPPRLRGSSFHERPIAVSLRAGGLASSAVLRAVPSSHSLSRREEVLS